MKSIHPRFLTDRFRVLRSLIVGLLITVVIYPKIPIKPALTFAITVALSWDLVALFGKTWYMSISQTRYIFERWQSIESYVVLRSASLVFLSVGVLSFCISDIHDTVHRLPDWVHILVTFIALFMTWLELHNVFALYYAKSYYELNTTELPEGQSQQGFIFEGSEPTFSDFIYVAYSIGLTYSMTDCSVEDSAIRRVVIIHCVASFLYTSTVLSIILSLVTQPPS